MMNAKQQQQYEIVGYSSKLFRDVTAAAYCHDEKQLHPHELDPYCTIDRFDVRGLLEFPIDYKRATTQVDGGSKLDERELLHKWRFGDFDDHRDHDDEHRKLLDEIEHEEKSKTSNGKFGAVGFDYDNGNNEEGEVKKENEENDKPYQVPADLKSLPKNVQLPQYQREHDIIEKTAEFLATQSIQMEILLKTKQSANDKFIFLDFGAELNDYYKFIKQAIKSGAYTAKKEPKKDDQSDSDSDSDSSGGYLHPSLLAGRAKQQQQQQPVTIEPEKPKIDENHPLFKIMKSRREAEEQKNQKKQDKLEAQKEANSTKITVPPPDVCQTVTWTAQFLAKMDSVARVSETQRLLDLNPSLSFLRGADIFHNYYKTILERTLMAQIGGGAGGHSPPPTPSHTTIAYHQIEGKPISFQINSKNDTTTPTSKPLDQADINEKLRKAQEVAQRIGAQREIEQKMQRRLKENLHGVNQRVRQAEEHLRSQHDASLAMRQSAQLISQGIVPPPPSGAPDSDGSDDSDDRARNRRSRSRERSRRRRSRSRDRRRSRSRKRSRRPERKSRRKRTRRSRSKS